MRSTLHRSHSVSGNFGHSSRTDITESALIADHDVIGPSVRHPMVGSKSYAA
jgi:hypothetical protein